MHEICVRNTYLTAGAKSNQIELEKQYVNQNLVNIFQFRGLSGSDIKSLPPFSTLLAATMVSLHV